MSTVPDLPKTVWQQARSFLATLFHQLRRVNGMIWGVLLLALIVWFVWQQRGDVRKTGDVLRSAHGSWVLLMFVAALGLHLTFALTQTSLLRGLGHRIPLWPAISTYLERQTVATVVPLGQAPSFVVLVKRFARYGVTNDDAIYSGLLYSIIGYASFAAFLIPILMWLGVQGSVTRGILLAAVVLIVVVVAIAGVFLQVLRGGRIPSSIERRIPQRFWDFVATARAHQLGFRHLVPSIALALLGDVAGIVTLYLALRAVGAEVSVGVAVAGYTVGTLFLLVAPLFQGLGVVELSMTLMLQQLGVPAPQALGATLLYRVADVWLPVVFGIALQARHQRVLGGVPGRLPALWTGLNGVISILSVMPHPIHHSVRPRDRLATFEFFTLHTASRSITLALGFLLVLLSYGLWKRRRTAWLVAVVSTAMIIGSHIGKGHDHLAVVVAAANLLLLILYAERFNVRSDRPTITRAFAACAVTMGLALGYGVFSLWELDRRQFGQEFSLVSALKQSLELYFSLDSAGLAPRTAYAQWLVHSFHVVGALTVAVAVFSLLRPYVWRHRTQPSERARAREIITQYGDSSEDFFKYSDDKFFFFASDGRGVVSYGVSSGVALVLGDPVAADETAFDRLLDEFLDFVSANGWQPAFHHATPRRVAAYRRAGLVVLRIGAEAVVDVDAFSLEGKHGKSFRNLLSKFGRDGWTLMEWESPQSEAHMTELRSVSDEWLTLDGRRERAFTLGVFEDAYVRDSIILAVQHEDGTVAAFVNLIPDGAPGEMTFDLMRHRVDAPNGAMDFVMLSMIQYARAHGFHALSLGMVPFADASMGDDVPVREHALALLTKNFNRFFAADSLYAYKDKFHPDWNSRYLVYATDTALPAIGLAITRLTERSHDGMLMGKSVTTDPTPSFEIPVVAPSVSDEDPRLRGVEQTPRTDVETTQRSETIPR